MNHCEKYEELCSAYLDGELTAEERAGLEAHLAACPDCEAYLAALRQTQTVLAHGRAEMPHGLHEDIMSLVMAEAEKTVVQTEKPHRNPPVFTMLAAAVAAVLLVMTGAVGELVSTGRDMLGLDDAKTAADSAAAPKIAAAQDDAGDAAASEVTPFSAPATDTVPETAAPTPPAGEEDETVSPEAGGTVGGAADSQNGPAGAAAGSAPEVSSGQEKAAAQQDTVQSRMMIASSQEALPRTPASLQEQSFAFCYVARGTGEAPSIEATYLDRSADGSASYYAIKNNMSVLEKALADLSKGGYEPEQYSSGSGVLLDGKAENGLIIVISSN
ncbi:MAG: anti-sigma factor [Intestinibacillus sp.]